MNDDPVENLLGPRKRRVSLLNPDDHPDGTVPPDDDELTEQSEEDEDDGEQTVSGA